MRPMFATVLVTAACALPLAAAAQERYPTLKPDQGRYRANFMSPEEMVRHDREWNDLFRKLFLQGG